MIAHLRTGRLASTHPVSGQQRLSILSTGKGVDGFEPSKTTEITVSGDDLGNAVFEAQGNDMDVVNLDEDVRIDRLHRLTPIHEIEQGVPVKQVNSGQLRGFPTPQPQLVGSLGARTQGAAKKIIGHRMESAPFFGSLSLQFAEELFVDRQSGSCHMQNHPSYASRCQRAWSAGLKVRRVPIFDGPMARFEVDQ